MARSSVKEVNSSANGPANGPAAHVEAVEPKGTIYIPAPVVLMLQIKIVGDSPLICNAFPDKLKKEMEEKRLQDETAPHEESQGTSGGKKKQKPRPPRDFDKEFRDSLYPIEGGGYGFPAIAFKRAIVGACRNVDGLTMKDADRLIYVKGVAFSKGFDVVPIEGKPIKREDVVRVGNYQDKQPDIRFRGEFPSWSCVLNIKFFPKKISQAQLVNLIQWAGITEGVGEMRPSAPKKSFEFGQFHPVVKS
jgi:hypothetical protein